MVTGPLGSGKTLLRQALVASTNKQSVQSVVVSARGAGDAAGVLRQVAQSLDVAQAEVGAILKQVVQLALTGQEVYLLVDDAEQLDESALEALLGGGFRPGGLYILAARPSVGKSSFAESLSLHAARQGNPTLFLSQEMSSEEVADRAISHVGRVRYDLITQAKVGEDQDWLQMADAAGPALRSVI